MEAKRKADELVKWMFSSHRSSDEILNARDEIYKLIREHPELNEVFARSGAGEYISMRCSAIEG